MCVCLCVCAGSEVKPNRTGQAVQTACRGGRAHPDAQPVLSLKNALNFHRKLNQGLGFQLLVGRSLHQSIHWSQANERRSKARCQMSSGEVIGLG